MSRRCPPEISRQVAVGEKVGLCQLKWRRLCFQERPTVLRPLGRPQLAS